MLTLTIGSKAYFDSFNGLVPCRVTGIRGLNGLASTSQSVTVELTASRAAYRRGETITTSALFPATPCVFAMGKSESARITSLLASIRFRRRRVIAE